MAATCNFDILPKDCTLDTCCMEQATVSYRPTLGGNAAYAAIFGVLLLAQIVLVLCYRRTWGFFIGMACCLILEVVGYAGRIMIYNNPFDLDNFIIYLVCLTIGPAFMMAAIYLCTSRVFVAIGSQHSRIPPRWISKICIVADLISLVLQALGGALAATSVKTTGPPDRTGVHIMVGGLIFQLVSTLFFVAVCIDFTVRALRSRGDRNSAFRDLVYSRRFRSFVAALGVATLTIFIRSVFRVAELWDGFNSHLANDEVTFMIFEGPMLIIAGTVLTVLHPGLAFAGRYAEAHWKAARPQRLREQKDSDIELVH